MSEDNRGRLEPRGLQDLFDALESQGYRLVGPTIRDGAIVYDEIASVADLPRGFTDKQEAGSYRLEERGDEALFGYVVGPHSFKKFLHPPASRLWTARRDGQDFAIVPEPDEAAPLAFIGIRACEIHAIRVQDKVFGEGDHVDAAYTRRREKAFFLAVNCGAAGGTCFCVSMDTGPRVRAGFDLALTEVLDGGRHYFVVEVGSERGARILDAASPREATEEERSAADRIVRSTARSMGRMLDTTDIQDLLYGNREHPRWEDVAARCETCASCTMVCPTCFCTTIEDVTDLGGQHAERWSRWDSCFTMDFSYIHGGSIRASSRARYRQWMTHKLAAWIDQFGMSGCVGCGRCITWCPVGIDITEEVHAIRATDHREVTATSPA